MPNQAETYGQPQVRTAPLAAPLVNPGIASPDAFGAGIAEGANRAAKGIFRAQEIRADQRAKVADTKAMDAYLKLSEADGKLSSQSRLKTGINAKDLPDTYNQEYRKLVDEQTAALQDDPEALDVFNHMAERRRVSSVDDIQRHSDSEMRKFQVDTWEAGQVQARNDGLSGVISLDESLNQQRGNRQRLADIHGIPQAEADLQWQDDKNKTIGGAIAADIDQDNITGAQTTLDKYGHELSEPLRADFEGKLKKLGENQKAQNFSDAIFKSGNFKTKGDIDRAVGLIDDEKTRSAVQVKVDHEWARREYAKQEENKAVYEEGTVHVEEGRSVQVYLAKYGDKMTSGQRESLLRYSDMVAASEEAEPTGPRYVELRNSIVASPKEFMKLNLAEDKANLSKRDYKELVEMQLSMAQGNLTKGSKEDLERGIFSPPEIGLQTLAKTGVDVSMKDGKFKDQNALSFMVQYSNLVAQGGGSKNKSDKELRDLASGLLVQHRIEDKTGIFTRTTTVPRFMIKGADTISYNTQDMPPETKEKIIKDLETVWGPRVDPKTGEAAPWLTEEALLSGWANTQADNLLQQEVKQKPKTNPDSELLFMGY